MYPVVSLALLTTLAALTQGQRITTIQLEGVQYFVSRMNPYSPELNWFLAYQYCRSIGLQLASFETKEKADYFMEYLRNAGYSKYDFWTSGNRLGTDMFLWMSTGLPFNVTFNYMKGDQDSDPLSSSLTHGPQPITRKKRGDSGASNGCVAMKKPELQWDTDDCTAVKDFICEQTRCYYYNYGSIPVSTAQGVPPTFSSSPYASPSTTSPTTGTPSLSVATRKISSPFTTPRREPTTSAYRTEAYPTTTEDQAKMPESVPKIPESVPRMPESVPRMPEEAPKMRDDEPHAPKVHEESQEYITTSDSSEDYNTHPEAEQTTAAIHEETNELHSMHLNMRDPGIGGSRGMPHELSETFSWPWARNIMLEKPVARKTSSTDE